MQGGKTILTLAWLSTLCLSAQIWLQHQSVPNRAISVSNTTVLHGNVILLEPAFNSTRRNYVPSYEGMNIGYIPPKPFDPWPESRPFPCFPPVPENRNVLSKKAQTTATNVGFFFVKPMKTASSTSSGISLRIVRNEAMRLHNSSSSSNDNNDNDNNNTTSNFDMCNVRFMHGLSSRFENRTKEKSFLWSIVRDPTKRATSAFFHFEVSRQKVEPTDSNFQEYLTRRALTPQTIPNYYLRTLYTLKPNRQTLIRKFPLKVIEHILNEYDFIGITERMDESLVALMMILNLRFADILHLDAKSSGGFDGACFYIQPSFVTEGMKKFFNSEKWRKTIANDLILYKAANESLDLTIDRLGRSRFLEQLQTFRAAQKEVLSRCTSQAVFPCTNKGEKTNSTDDCLWNDGGCGIRCIDEVATDLNLW